MKHLSLSRRAVLVGAAVIAAATLAACDSTGSTGSTGTTASATSTGGPSSRPAATFDNVDVMFLWMMIRHHQQAVDMAALAQTRAANPQVKQLAADIKATQTAEIATMKRWLAAWGEPTAIPSGHHMSGMPSGMPSMPGGGMMPSGMPSGMPSMPGVQSGADMARLKAATGKDFDKLFLQMMIDHHEGAIQMARAEQANGSNPEVKAFAGRIISQQQAEIATMQRILGAMMRSPLPSPTSSK